MEVFSNSLGCLGTLVKDTAGATHALAYGVPDRELNETKYLKDALKVINDWQSRCSRRLSEGHLDRDSTEVVLVERPQRSQMEPCDLCKRVSRGGQHQRGFVNSLIHERKTSES